LTAALDALAGQYRCEILYVDDGSRDRTLPILRRLAAQDGRVRYLSLSRNFGNQAALTAGLEHAAGDVVVTIDSDLQHPPALIPTLLAKWREGYDVVITSRSSGTEQAFGWLKRKSSATFHRLMQRWSEVDVRVNSTDFRLLSRKAVDALLQLRETHRYVRGMVQWLGFPTFEVTFPADSRRAGETKFTAGRLLRFGFDSLLSFSRMPLRVAVAAGLAMTALRYWCCCGSPAS
jgi:dolichol-phosphate mannosyltransferase